MSLAFGDRRGVIVFSGDLTHVPASVSFPLGPKFLSDDGSRVILACALIPTGITRFRFRTAGYLTLIQGR